VDTGRPIALITAVALCGACDASEPPGRAQGVLAATASLFADGRAGFTDVRTATVAFDSLVAVADAHSGSIFLVRDTTIVDQVGRLGRGPLEFLDVASLVAVDGALVVFDRPERALTVLDSDLRLLREERLPGRRLLLSAFRLGTRGVAVVETASRADLAALWTPDVLAPDSVRWRARAVLELVPGPPGRSDVWDGTFFGGGRSGTLRVGWPREAYLIHSVDLASGGVGVAARRALPAPAPTALEREAALARAARASELIGVRVGEEDDELHPHFGQHVEDRCRRTWVLTHRGGDRRTILDVFGADGAFVGEIGLQGDVVGVAGFLARPVLVTIVRDAMDRRGIAFFDLPPELACGQAR